MIVSQLENNKDSDQNTFIDRDGQLFRYILNFLRDGQLNLPSNFHEHAQLILEAKFFCLDVLVDVLEDLLPKEPAQFFELSDSEGFSSISWFVFIGGGNCACYVLGYWTSEVQIWNVAQNKLLYTYRSHLGGAYYIGGLRVAFIDMSTVIEIDCIPTPTQSKERVIRLDRKIHSVVYYKDRIAVMTQQFVYVYNIISGECLHSIAATRGRKAAVASVFADDFRERKEVGTFSHISYGKDGTLGLCLSICDRYEQQTVVEFYDDNFGLIARTLLTFRVTHFLLLDYKIFACSTTYGSGKYFVFFIAFNDIARNICLVLLESAECLWIQNICGGVTKRSCNEDCGTRVHTYIRPIRQLAFDGEDILACVADDHTVRLFGISIGGACLKVLEDIKIRHFAFFSEGVFAGIAYAEKGSPIKFWKF